MWSGSIRRAWGDAWGSLSRRGGRGPPPQAVGGVSFTVGQPSRAVGPLTAVKFHPRRSDRPRVALSSSELSSEVVTSLTLPPLRGGPLPLSKRGFKVTPNRSPHPTNALAGQPTVLVAAAALIDVDGRVLICQRPKGKAGRSVGVSRRQGRARRDARTVPDPRAARGAGHQGGPGLPGPVRFCAPTVTSPFTYSCHSTCCGAGKDW